MDCHGTIYSDKDAIRAANLLILKKVWDICTPKAVKMDSFYKMLGISRSAVDRIIEGDSEMGQRWNTSVTAEAFGIDEGVLRGERLLIIEGESIHAIQEEYDKALNNKEISEGGRDRLRKNRDEYTSELSYWKSILQNKTSDKDDIWQNSKNTLLREVGEQAKNPDFNDVNLWKYWYHIKDIKG